VVLATGTCAMLHKTKASAISVYCTVVGTICNILHCGQCIMHLLWSGAMLYTNYGL